MIADFVDRRGGGLLMIGGPRAFGEGGYGGTPVADALPLQINPTTRASDPAPLARLKVAPTKAGEGHAATQIRPTQAASAARWNELPQVTSVNAPLPLKRSHRAPDRHRPAAATRSCSPPRASVAARPSPSPPRTPGSGRCTPRFRSGIRRTSSSGAS
jgi:hypothetical protein